jgi:hypothetical protein
MPYTTPEKKNAACCFAATFQKWGFVIKDQFVSRNPMLQEVVMINPWKRELSASLYITECFHD